MSRPRQDSGMRPRQGSSRQRRNVIERGSEGDGPPLPIFTDSDATLHGIQDRLNVLDELLNTERDYLADLSLVVDSFLIPCVAQEIVPHEDARQVFLNIDQLRDVHMTLFAALDAKISDIQFAQCIEHCITEIFEEAIPQMRMYVDYSIGYASAIKMLAKLKSRTPAFASFIEGVEGAQSKKLRLQDYLIKPVQRLCKYPLMFKQLLKHTAEDHEDHAYMSRIMQQLIELTEHVEECNQRAEKERECMQLYNNLPDFPSEEMDTTREVVRRGEANVNSSGQWKQRHLLLFGDLLVVCKVKNKKGQFPVVSVVALCAMLISAEDSASANRTPTGGRKKLLKRKSSETGALVHGYQFHVVDMKSKKKLAMSFDTEAERDEWKQGIEQCISNIHGDSPGKALLAPAVALRPTASSHSLSEVKRDRKTLKEKKLSKLAHGSEPSPVARAQSAGDVLTRSPQESPKSPKGSSPLVPAKEKKEAPPRPARKLCASPSHDEEAAGESSGDAAKKASPEEGSKDGRSRRKRTSSSEDVRRKKRTGSKKRSGSTEDGDDHEAIGGSPLRPSGDCDGEETSRLRAELAAERAKRKAAELKVTHLEKQLAEAREQLAKLQ